MRLVLCWQMNKSSPDSYRDCSLFGSGLEADHRIKIFLGIFIHCILPISKIHKKMKSILLIILATFSLTTYGQDKYNYISFNKLMEVEGTEYVIARVENWGKMEGLKNRYLLFINTKNGQTNQVDFPNEGYFQGVEQVKIDSLKINCLLVSAQTVDLDGKKGIGWNDPRQIIILSTDGQQKIQLTDSKLFVSTWVINKTTGTIIITGHYDTNNNGKHDKTDKNEIGIYDLKTLRLITKI